MQRDVNDPESRRGFDRGAWSEIEPSEILRTRALGENLRVTGVSVAREVEGLLVQRRRHDGVDLMFEREIDRAIEGTKRRVAPFGRDFPDLNARDARVAAWYDGDCVGAAERRVVARGVGEFRRVDRADLKVELVDGDSARNHVGIAKNEGASLRQWKRVRRLSMLAFKKIAPCARDDFGPDPRGVPHGHRNDRFFHFRCDVFLVFSSSRVTR